MNIYKSKLQKLNIERNIDKLLKNILEKIYLSELHHSNLQKINIYRHVHRYVYNTG